jgi:hypothetical protein
VRLYLAALDALRDGDLLLARQQRDGAHLTQVDADGVGRFLVLARREVEVVNLVERPLLFDVRGKRGDLGD